MKKTFQILLISLSYISMLQSCKKSIDNGSIGSGGGGSTTTNDVYVAGDEYTINSNNQIATYWKNGTAVHLSDGTSDAEATAITVSGTDVYVAGYDGTVGKYWKNGMATTLPNCSVPLSIAVSGTDVYVAGYSGIYTSGAPYWKNGVELFLPTDANATGGSGTTSVAINGSDVYIGGQEIKSHPQADTTTAIYWKNGSAVPLTNGKSIATVSSMVISNNDIYIAGSIQTTNGSNDVGGYWKNGTWNPLGNLQFGPNIPTSIAFNGSDVYMGTILLGYSGYWKNTTSAYQFNFKNVSLPTGYSLVGCEGTTAMAINANNIYASGTLDLQKGNIADNLAVYWRNDTLVQLTQANSDANAIFVK